MTDTPKSSYAETLQEILDGCSVALASGETIFLKSPYLASFTKLLAEIREAKHSKQTKPPLDHDYAIKTGILLTLGNLEAIKLFQRTSLTDKQLPFNAATLHLILAPKPPRRLTRSKTISPKSFLDAQIRWFPAIFELDTHQDLAQDAILPFVSRRIIGRGNTSRVYEVSIPEDFVGESVEKKYSSARYKFGGESDEGGCRYAYKFALKEFHVDESETAKRESYAASCLRSHENFIRQVCSYTQLVSALGLHGQGPNQPSTPPTGSVPAFRILLEMGDCSLDTIFRHQTPPILPRAIKTFWRGLIDVARAIRAVHTENGYHHDIKPHNIIRTASTLKLSDFGFSRFANSKTEIATSQPGFCTRSYGPAESLVEKKCPIYELQKYDLWSLGAVFSEAATWLVLGPSGVAKYREFRAAGLVGDDGIAQVRGDYFHDGVKVKEAVNVFHRYLRKGMRKEDGVSAAVLDVVDGKLFVGPDERVDAEKLVEVLEGVMAGTACESSEEEDAFATIEAFFTSHDRHDTGLRENDSVVSLSELAEDRV